MKKNYKNIIHVQKYFFGALFLATLLLTPVSFTSPNHHKEGGGLSFAQKVFAQSSETKKVDTKAPTAASKPSAPTQPATPTKPAPQEVKKDGTDWSVSAIIDLPNRLITKMGNVFLSATSMLTWAGGKSLEFVLDKFVFGMGALIQNNSFGRAIDTSWTLIRDIANLAFIFSFVFIGIKTIIDPEDSSVKKLLSRIIISALLINFSIFFVKIIIDFTNLTSLYIFKTLTTGGGSLSATVANKLGIVTIFESGDPEQYLHMTTGASFWFFLLAGILLLMVAFIFFAASFLLLSRFVSLIIIMVASPILFAAPLFPQTKHYASEMWSKLIANAFYAPAFLIMILISLILMNGLGTQIVPGGGSIAKALNNASSGSAKMDMWGIIVNFFLIIFFFLQSLLIADKLSIKGSETAIKLSKQFTGGATAGMAARMGRATIGKWAHTKSNSDDLKDRASQGGAGGWLARQQLKASRSLSDASFDARNVKGAGKTLGIGEGRKGGYATVKEEVKGKEEKFAKSLGEIGDTDMLVKARKEEWESAQKLQKTESQLLRDKMKGLDKDDIKGRLALQGDIDKLEKDTRDAQIKYEKEKQRRIIGSTFNNPDEFTSNIDSLKKESSSLVKEMLELNKKKSSAATKTEKDEIYRSIKELKEKHTSKITELKKQEELLNLVSTNKDERGYAGVLEADNWKTSWPTGRMVVHNNEAGKAIRKTAEKGLPKEK